MTKFCLFALLFTGFLRSAVAGPDFFLKAQPYADPEAPALPGPPLYVTRYGFLVATRDDADVFSISEESGRMMTFPGKARKQTMGILIPPPTNTTTPIPMSYPPLTCIPPGHGFSKITTEFSAYDGQDGTILVFENDKFKNADKEAVFLVEKGESLESSQVLVATTFKDLDWEKFVLVDLVVVEEEKRPWSEEEMVVRGDEDNEI